MSADYFASFDTVRYEGPESTNDLAYRWYDKDRVVLGKRMEEHLRFAVCFWHTFCWPGSDVFGGGTFNRPWHAGPNDATRARAKREAALSFVEKLDLPFYCFHDVDVMADANDATAFRSSFAACIESSNHGRSKVWPPKGSPPGQTKVCQ
jgi:xylose isomerase